MRAYRPVPTHINTGLDALRLCARMEAEWGMWIDIAHVQPAGQEVLTLDHEGQIMAEYGPDALIRYYAPGDPRLAPLDAEQP